jgi:hypothetical protein
VELEVEFVLSSERGLDLPEGLNPVSEVPNGDFAFGLESVFAEVAVCVDFFVSFPG